MKINKTGIQMAGEGRFKVLIMGGAGVGKTRWSSFWPKPFYADCEDGLLSVMDREVPFVSIHTSDDMLEFLQYCKAEGNKPRQNRRFDTVVIDTLDSYQRKVADEWVLKNKAPGFTGWEAWDYLDQKMQQLMTRLLNLPFNVVVLAHIKDKTVEEGVGDTSVRRTEHVLRLRGSSKDWVVDDFDLIGRMGHYYVPGETGRVKKRGITFAGDDEWPDLKDRWGMLPDWLPVEFVEEDYTGLFALWLEKVEELEKEGVGNNAEDIVDEEVVVAEEGPGAPPEKSEKVVEDTGGGPVPESVPKGVPFDQLNRPQLIALARQVPDLADKVKGNTTKSTVVGLLEKHRAEHGSEWTDDGHYLGAGMTLEGAADSEPASSTDVKDDEPDTSSSQVVEGSTEGESEADAEVTEDDTESEAEPEEPVASEEPAADESSGGSSDDYDRSAEGVCSVKGCTPDLPGTPENIKRLSKIKYRRFLCGTDEGCFENCYSAAKDARSAPEGRGWSEQYVS